MISWPLVSYVLKAAIRDKLVISLLIVLLLGTSLSLFLGSSAIVEPQHFAMVFAGGALRMIGAMGLILFTVFFIRRSFEAKDVELMLSRPIGRVQFLLSYAAGLSLLAVMAGIAQGLCVYAISFHAFEPGHLIWIASIMVENIIMVNVALFFAMILSSAASAAMAVYGFYILARMMGQILGTIDAGSRVYDLKILEYIMQAISSVMPRLDLLGQTSWLVYGADTQIGLGFVFVQGLVFTALILIASLIDLVRRQF